MWKEGLLLLEYWINFPIISLLILISPWEIKNKFCPACLSEPKASNRWNLELEKKIELTGSLERKWNSLGSNFFFFFFWLHKLILKYNHFQITLSRTFSNLNPNRIDPVFFGYWNTLTSISVGVAIISQLIFN